MNVIITGTSRGIGLELTKQSLEKGYMTLAVARKSTHSDALLKLGEQYKNIFQFLDLDVSLEQKIPAIAKAVESWKSVDVLINNAGMYAKGDSQEDFLKSFTVNTIAPYLVTKALLPKLQQSSQPKVVQISSLMGSVADTSGGAVVYRSSKAALNMVNKVISGDHSFLTAIVMHPGWVKTDMGGSTAPVEIPDSAKGIWTVITKLKHDDTGKFFNFRGENLPW